MCALECDCVPLLVSAGLVALVSPADYDRFARYKWQLHPRGYLVRHAGGQPHYMHRLAADMSNCQRAQVIVDHEDGNKLHNGRHNLRPATHAQNAWNRKPQEGKSCPYKGVTLRLRPDGSTPARPYQARIAFEGKAQSLGFYATAEEAAEAYNRAATELYGSYARLNKIEEEPDLPAVGLALSSDYDDLPY